MPETTQDPGGSTPPAPGNAGARSAPGGAPDSQGDATSKYAAAHEYVSAKANGNAMRAVRLLLKDNHGLREALGSRKALPEGSVVLAGDDAAAWAEFQKLGKPADVKRQLDELPTLRSFKAEAEQTAQMEAVGKDVGFKGRVLADRIRATPGATLEQRGVTVSKNGKDEVQQVWHIVTGEGAAAKAERLVAYAEREWADYLPALREGASSTSSTPSRREADAPRYPQQRESGEPGGSEGSTYVDGYLRSTRVRPSQRSGAPGAARERDAAGAR